MLLGLIGEEIRKKREGLKLSQFGLAKKSNVTPATISNCELNKYSPTLETLQAIANGLDCDIEITLKEKTA